MIALSDHDTTDGLVHIQQTLKAMAATGNNIQLIPAIEMSSGKNGLTHILGYGVRPNTQPLASELDTLRRMRVERTHRTIEAVNRLAGVTISETFLENPETLDHTVGRVHVALLMVAKQLVGSVDEAFAKYLGEGKPAFIPLIHNSTESAVQLLLQSRAVPVLAHPMRSGLEGEELERFIINLHNQGLMGIEVFHPSASRSDIRRLYSLARRLNLLVTGGSDFHGEWSLRNSIGEYPAGWNTWRQDTDDLLAAISAADAC